MAGFAERNTVSQKKQRLRGKCGSEDGRFPSKVRTLFEPCWTTSRNLNSEVPYFRRRAGKCNIPVDED